MISLNTVTFHPNHLCILLMKQQCVVAHTVCQTEIPTLLDSSVLNTTFCQNVVSTKKLLALIIIIISIQPEGRFWQEPEPSQATGMALAHCIISL